MKIQFSESISIKKIHIKKGQGYQSRRDVAERPRPGVGTQQTTEGERESAKRVNRQSRVSVGRGVGR